MGDDWRKCRDCGLVYNEDDPNAWTERVDDCGEPGCCGLTSHHCPKCDGQSESWHKEELVK